MEIGKLLMLGGAAFAAYEFFKPTAAPAAGAAHTTGSGIVTGQTPPVQQPTPAALASNTQAMILAAAAKDHFGDKGTVDQWDWFYSIARGIPAPDPEADWGLTPVTRNEILTFPEFWALASSHGLSGYQRV